MDIEPEYKPFIIMFIIVGVLLFFAMRANASRDDEKFLPVGAQYVVKADPIVTVERYEPQDYRNDETILIAGERVKPIVWVAESRPITPEEKAEFLPPAEVKITATISSDIEDEVNYPL